MRATHSTKTRQRTEAGDKQPITPLDVADSPETSPDTRYELTDLDHGDQAVISGLQQDAHLAVLLDEDGQSWAAQATSLVGQLPQAAVDDHPGLLTAPSSFAAIVSSISHGPTRVWVRIVPIG
jgi:hypothetical protein